MKLYLCLAALVLVACGGGGDDSANPPPQAGNPPVLNHPVTVVNNTFTLTAGEFNAVGGVHHAGYEGNALNLGSITATPAFGRLSTFHYQQEPGATPASHLTFYGQVIPNGVFTSVTVVRDDGLSVTLRAADATYALSPLNANGTPNGNTATFWSWPGNPFNFVGGRTYTVTFQ